nr:MAG TPA: hypothetical protein [Caudoviricetes sp.]
MPTRHCRWSDPRFKVSGSRAEIHQPSHKS